MNRSVRIGLAGLGVIARTHLDVLAERPDVSLAFTVDPGVSEPPEFRGSAPRHYPALVTALEHHRPDLVILATPTDTHADLAELVLTRSAARVLVEKPLVHDLGSLARLRALNNTADVRDRVFAAHHFAFSPEVRWAATQIERHPEWGPVTAITSAFHDPYIVRVEQAFASYLSSWLDSGANQLSMLSRFVEITEPLSTRALDRGASSWRTYAFRSRGTTGTARLRTSWCTGASSKETVLAFADSGVEVWIDHTAMTGFAADSRGRLLVAHGNDGLTPRKVAHYRPLYDSLLSEQPDPLLRFDAAAVLTELHHAVPEPA
ncbi:Gfo/Idh/MocA family protein [Streptomyces aidingensis]|uniref:Predicted dehydrogenase n=1 Tax=Streptomyces aidingensis TaxID=910347 RepID=A0A1I1FQ78_9ACTN|nr:Gfo/Idh/MocA family oxidoreductase [Streptomyces aidingensis]SFC01719.1 Predicted dehydrogenase [Streptomyces aidingensis]